MLCLSKTVIGWLSKKEIKERLFFRVGFIISLSLGNHRRNISCFTVLSLILTHTHVIYVYILYLFLFTMLSYLTYFIGNEQQHKCCNRPKSSLLHSCIFPVAKYDHLLNGVITSISALWHFCMLSEILASQIRSVKNMIPARSNV